MGIGMCNRVENECPVKEKCLRYKGEPYFQTDAYNFPQICNLANSYAEKWEIEVALTEIKEEEAKK